VAWRYGHAWCPDPTSPSAQQSFSAATGSSREALPKRLAAAADLFHAHVLTGNTVQHDLVRAHADAPGDGNGAVVERAAEFTQEDKKVVGEWRGYALASRDGER
jgi:hypothetical protein